MARHQLRLSKALFTAAVVVTAGLAVALPGATAKPGTADVELTGYAQPAHDPWWWAYVPHHRRPRTEPPKGPLAFTIRATSVAGLYPGAVKPMGLTIANPYDVDLKLTALSADVTASSKPGCLPAAQNLVARPYQGRLPLVVHRHGQRAAGQIPLAMPRSVADACQKATFTVRLAGTATKVTS